jgi:hypothetical protein
LTETGRKQKSKRVTFKHKNKGFITPLKLFLFHFHSQPTFNEAKKNSLQNKFIAFEESLENHLKFWSNEPINYRYPDKKSGFDDFIYRGDSLIYWTSNSIPIDRFAAIQFPANGVVRLQNGWYYVKTLEKDKFIFCSTFLLSSAYSIQNEFLSPTFNPKLSTHNFKLIKVCLILPLRFEFIDDLTSLSFCVTSLFLSNSFI